MRIEKIDGRPRWIIPLQTDGVEARLEVIVWDDLRVEIIRRGCKPPWLDLFTSSVTCQLGQALQAAAAWCDHESVKREAEKHQAVKDRECVAEAHERDMFGCTTAAIDQVLEGKSPRDVAMYAMGTLSNAQELIHRDEHEGTVEWTVVDRDATTIRQFINIAKYVVDKALPQ
jgi:hypothetical protein